MLKSVLCLTVLVQTALGLGFVNTILVPGVNPWIANLNPGVNTNFLNPTTLAGYSERPQQFRNLRNPFIYTETIVPFAGWVLIDRGAAIGRDVYGQYPFLAYRQFIETGFSPTGLGEFHGGFIVFDSSENIRNDYVYFQFSSTSTTGVVTQICKHIVLNGQLQWLCPETAIVGYFITPGQSPSFTQSKFNQIDNLRIERRSYEPYTRSTSFEQLNFAANAPYGPNGVNSLVGDYIQTSSVGITNDGIVPCCNFN